MHDRGDLTSVCTADPLYTINSPSMKPSLSPGDVVGIRAVDPWEIEEGDVVAYVKDGVPVVHRVAEVRWVGYDVITNIKKPDGTVESEVTQRQPREFVFRGDNNPADDSDVVQQSQIIGRQPSSAAPVQLGGHLLLTGDAHRVRGVSNRGIRCLGAD
ncbi:MAG: signal peptidase I [Dehalococcoidia bacterium]|nr:signal peptidase I [Dehalococcoidia bacterium]